MLVYHLRKASVDAILNGEPIDPNDIFLRSLAADPYPGSIQIVACGLYTHEDQMLVAQSRLDTTDSVFSIAVPLDVSHTPETERNTDGEQFDLNQMLFLATDPAHYKMFEMDSSIDYAERLNYSLAGAMVLPQANAVVFFVKYVFEYLPTATAPWVWAPIDDPKSSAGTPTDFDLDVFDF